MTIREALNKGYRLHHHAPFREEHYEVTARYIKPGEPLTVLLGEDELRKSPYIDRDCAMIFHAEGTTEDPIRGEHVLRFVLNGGYEDARKERD